MLRDLTANNQIIKEPRGSHPPRRLRLQEEVGVWEVVTEADKLAEVRQALLAMSI